MVCAALAREQGYSVLALTVDYNQRHRVEIEAARRIAAALADRHIVLPLDLRAFGGSALTSDTDVPKDGVQPGIPVTYVPARNLVFLSLALAWAEAEGARDLFIGVNALDYSGYPDCRPEFVAGFEQLARLATKAGSEGEADHDPRAAAAHDQGGHRARGEPARARRGAQPQLLRSAAGRKPLRPVRRLPAACQGLRRSRACRIRRATRLATQLMAYAVKECFLTLQGEGVQSGSRAVFLRFAGCNLWSGREQDRATAQCNFCDTDFVGTDGEGGGKFADAECACRSCARRPGAKASDRGWW